VLTHVRKRCCGAEVVNFLFVIIQDSHQTLGPATDLNMETVNKRNDLNTFA
jgi:hypothetical protein